MIVASFLAKDLHIDWRSGERYFAQKLVDYDPAVNNGNWQWCASTGCDAQPYFRIFNPWLQQRRYDPFYVHQSVDLGVAGYRPCPCPFSRQVKGQDDSWLSCADR
jgi:deoxyribodipyrimidine photolyase